MVAHPAEVPPHEAARLDDVYTQLVLARWRRLELSHVGHLPRRRPRLAERPAELREDVELW